MLRTRLTLALFAAFAAAPALAQTAPAAPTPEPREAAQAALEQHAQAVAQATLAARAASAAVATPEARVAEQAALAELDAAQQELRVASARVAELHSVMAREQIETALRRPVFARPMLGIVMGRDDNGGVKLLAVTPDSPAAKAGLRTGDRLLRIGNTALAGDNADARLAFAQDSLRDLDEGDSVTLQWQRDGKTHEAEIAARTLSGITVWNGQHLERLANIEIPLDLHMDLGQLAPLAGCGEDGRACEFAAFSEAWRWQGLQLAQVGPELGRYFGTDRGVLVLAAPDESMAALKPGDVIQQVDGERVDTPQEAMRALRGKEPGTPVAISLLRDRKTQRASVDAPRRMRYALPAPPAPPAPPTPPNAPGAAPPAPPSPPASAVPQTPRPPSPPAAPRGVLDTVLN